MPTTRVDVTLVVDHDEGVVLNDIRDAVEQALPGITLVSRYRHAPGGNRLEAPPGSHFEVDSAVLDAVEVQ